jgi:hypothetical protein
LRNKGRQLDEEASIEIELHRSIQDSLKFYKCLNVATRTFEPQVAMCRANNGRTINQQLESAGEMERTF